MEAPSSTPGVKEGEALPLLSKKNPSQGFLRESRNSREPNLLTARPLPLKRNMNPRTATEGDGVASDSLPPLRPPPRPRKG